MRIKTKFWSSKNLENHIGKLLKIGIYLSSTIALFGGIIYISKQPNEIQNFKKFSGTADHLRQLIPIFSGVIRFDGQSIIQLGVITLLLTPIFRIVFSAIGFLFERDYLYVAISITVLLIIILNMIWGIE